MPEVLENRLVIRFGIVEFVVDDTLLHPGAIQARCHRVVRRRGITRGVTEVVIAAVLVHPRGLEKVLDLDVFGSAREFEHVLLEFHATARIPRAPIHPDVIAVIENRGVDVQFHIVRRIVCNERMPDSVFPRARRMIRHGDTDGKAFAPVFLDGSVMYRHIPIELTVTVFAMPRKRTRIRPLESLDAQHRAVIVIVFHVVGHQHVPIVHHERLVVIALRTLLVVPCKNEQAIVIHERRGIRRIEIRGERVRRETSRSAQKHTYKVFEHNTNLFREILRLHSG